MGFPILGEEILLFGVEYRGPLFQGNPTIWGLV